MTKAVDLIALTALLAGMAAPVYSQTFVNLDFDQARLPHPPPEFVPQLDWDKALPGWSHSEGDSTESVYYIHGHLGYSQFYVLLPADRSPFGAASGAYSVGMHNGSFREHEPRGDFTLADLAQTGVVPTSADSISLLASSFQFGVSINDSTISMRPVGLDPASPSYDTDLMTYVGEWTGDVGDFSGQLVSLKIYSTFPSFDDPILAIDEVMFLPVPEPSIACLMGLGTLALLVMNRRAK